MNKIETPDEFDRTSILKIILLKSLIFYENTLENNMILIVAGLLQSY